MTITASEGPQVLLEAVEDVISAAAVVALGLVAAAVVVPTRWGRGEGREEQCFSQLLRHLHNSCRNGQLMNLLFRPLAQKTL